MSRSLRHLLPRRKGLTVALWLLLLLAGSFLQVVAASHWHPAPVSLAAGTGNAPAPAPDGSDHDGCLLCQVAAHAGASAPPPAPWALYLAFDPQDATPRSLESGTLPLRPSHSWQGRAPPQA